MAVAQSSSCDGFLIQRHAADQVVGALLWREIGIEVGGLLSGRTGGDNN